MTYKWTDGATQDAKAARPTVYQEVLQAIGSGLATPFTVHCKVPRLESEVRARRVLDAMVTAGLLACHIRPGQAFYRLPGTDPFNVVKVTEEKSAPPATRKRIKRVPDEVRAIELLEKAESLTTGDIGGFLYPRQMKDPVSRNKTITKISRWMGRYMQLGIVFRSGIATAGYRYSLMRTENDHA